MPDQKFDFTSLPWTTTPNLVIPKSRKKARKKNLPKPRAERPPQFVTIHLMYGHSINGRGYGPGSVTVSPALAQALKESDGRAALTESRFHAERGAIIGPRTAQGSHKVTEVPLEIFDIVAENAPPADRSSGKGMIDPGLGVGQAF